MSATNRGIARNEKDYYITPAKTVNDFLKYFKIVEPNFNFSSSKFLDPCAGGDDTHDMRYVTGLKLCGATNIVSVDIRKDSKAMHKGDYLARESKNKYDAIFTNPPYNLAMEFIVKCRKEVVTGGFVGMLLRINYYGSQIRNTFWQGNMPKYTFLHSCRPKFTDKGSDATEYAHFVWEIGYKPRFSKLIII